MLAHGLEASAGSYNELPHAKVGKENAGDDWAIVAEMASANVQPNSVTRSRTLLKSLARATSEHGTDDGMALVEYRQEQMQRGARPWRVDPW